MRDFRKEVAPGILSRVRELQKRKASSVSQFSVDLGLSQTKVNNQFNGKYDISLELVCRILERYPEVSAEWLIRGIGGEFESVGDSKTEIGKASQEKDEVIFKLTEENTKIKDQIDTLYNIIKKLTDQ